MPVTSFYKVGSRMVGEQTDGGTRINYVTDALGSIVQAIDENHNTTYTARYKPFGDVLSATGTAPAFTWVGSLGYLQAAGRPHSEFYVRARFYSKAEGRWTTVDPLWPGESAYGYVSGRLTILSDPRGTAPDPTLKDACIYMYCSLKFAEDIYNDCSAWADVQDKWKDFLKDLLKKYDGRPKDGAIQDCVKDVKSGNGLLSTIIRTVCSSIPSDSSRYCACAYPNDTDKCNACCIKSHSISTICSANCTNAGGPNYEDYFFTWCVKRKKVCTALN